MKRIWPFFYVVGMILCVYGGFLGPDRKLDVSNMDWVTIAVGFVISSIMPLGWFGYAIFHSKKAIIPRPAFDRSPFGSFLDVLQQLRVSVLTTILLTTGMLIAFSAGRGQPGLIICMWLALSAGLTIGEWLVYRVYKARIAPHSRSGTALPLSEH